MRKTSWGRLKIALCVAGFLVFSGPQAIYANEPANIEKMLQSGQYDAVAKIWKDEANSGNTEAMRNLAKLHYAKSITDADPKVALSLLLGALKLGDQAANLDLGYLYRNGIGVMPDLLKSESYYKAGYEAGSPEAAYLFARSALSRNATKQEIISAIEALRVSSSEGYGPSDSAVADLMRTGKYLPRNLKSAQEYYEKAAENGYDDALNSIGDMYAFAEFGFADLETAEDWYRKAATKGVLAANYSLAFILYNNPDASETELREAQNYAKVASQGWDENAQILLGRMYLENRVGPIDAFEAYVWLDLAATANVIEAHHLRAIASRLLGEAKSAEAHLASGEWFKSNHTKPHNHRLIHESRHTLN